MPKSFLVLTYNIGNGRAAPPKLVDMLQSCGAEIVCLQEVSQAQGEGLENNLQGTFPNRSIFPGDFAGKAILSRYPINHTTQIHLSQDRPDLMAVMDIVGTLVTVISAHPPPPRFHRTGFHFDSSTIGQISALAELTRYNAPAILMGDFNLTKSQAEYQLIAKNGLKDAFRESGVGLGSTLPRRVGPWRRMHWLNRMIGWIPLAPVSRVDYIWYTTPMTCSSCWVGKDAGSDHLPVLARLEIP
jgi:vancomycin resistance protein VanJ